jgi:hypothetical protein
MCSYRPARSSNSPTVSATANRIVCLLGLTSCARPGSFSRDPANLYQTTNPSGSARFVLSQCVACSPLRGIGCVTFPSTRSQTSRNAEELPSMASLRVAKIIISCQVRCCLAYSQICAIFSRRSTVSEDAFLGRPFGLPDLPFSNGRPGPRRRIITLVVHQDTQLKTQRLRDMKVSASQQHSPFSVV